MHQALFDTVEQMIPMTAKDKELCLQYFRPFTYSKGELIEKAGTVHDYQNFIVSGHMRNFHVNEKGLEVTVDINEGPRFFSSYLAMMERRPSDENLQCITACDILRVKRDDINIMLKESTILKDYTILILQHFLEEDKKRLTEMGNLTAEERYRAFVQKNPMINRNVPLVYIASFLGIRPESLSRIRRQLIS
ncbi:Crp/Fnr family transcriptional regulator [Arthrospiribacter ruber]|uniref:Crp/Fnr family transcriptional regulator n=1 Tax=Arthrospiribacter ruber TaxID=2487934 RepID=A0A951MBG5_9BACT|nr:Crp/Fnr family transcriptional regulator [Arthrospiribacter ruber]MBW3466797.1 Crp/Fnr family transcriptional regulator [Arthrospiribacter ruber]MBW3469589.1 Crp/Fnr family transcriptional regulator [Arthrospiribacter ruber]MBW3470336.1 Crp/Fnr family transcriptional regulator [Arthrospiribacter ruber]